MNRIATCDENYSITEFGKNELDHERRFSDFYSPLNVLITGAGSVGSELSAKLMKFNPKGIRVIDINSDRLNLIKERFDFSKNIEVFKVDIRDYKKVLAIVDGMDFVFHTAALKYIHECEADPSRTIEVNILGTQNLVKAALEQRVSRFLYLNSDKAVNPKNIYGVSKLMAEKVVLSANNTGHSFPSIFSVVRLGNILGSNGSFLQKVERSINEKKDILITDFQMTRFLVTIEEAGDTLLKAGMNMRGGEIFIPKMRAIRLKDFFESFLEFLHTYKKYDLQDIKIRKIGASQIEKRHEEILTREESARLFALDGMFIVLPSHTERDLYPKNSNLSQSQKLNFNSREAEKIQKKELVNLLKKSIYPN